MQGLSKEQQLLYNKKNRDNTATIKENHGQSATMNNENKLRILKSPTNKTPSKSNTMKSPNYKTPLKAQQVTNFSNVDSPSNINMNQAYYDKFIQNFTPPPSITQPKSHSSKDKKRRISLSSYYDDSSESKSKKLKSDNSYRANDNLISPTNQHLIDKQRQNNKTSPNTSNSRTPNKLINISNTFDQLKTPLSSKEVNYTQTNTMHQFQNQYSNYINSIENSENGPLTSPHNDSKSKNLLSSYLQQNMKFVKNGYSEKLVNIISKKRSDFHIWLHSIQKSESINDMLKNTVIVEVKKVAAQNCTIEMKCHLIASFQKDFSEVYRKEGGSNALDIIVLTNLHRSWPSQSNIENTKIKLLLKDLRNKRRIQVDTPNLTSAQSTHSSSENHKKEKENDKSEPIVRLNDKMIQNGTLLIIKDTKTILKKDTLSSTSSRKKSLFIYNDLFLIFNI